MASLKAEIVASIVAGAVFAASYIWIFSAVHH